MDIYNEDKVLKIKEIPKIISFIAIWDDEIGPVIIDFYPKSDIGNLESLAIQIFIFYQYFCDTPDAIYKRTNITIPINHLNKKAKVLFDPIPNAEVRGGFQPFIIVLLVPDFLTEEQLNVFNEILLKISKKYSRSQNLVLKDCYQEVQNLFASIQVFKELEVEAEVSEYYSYTAAVEDFQAGIRLFKTRNYEQAYKILRRVLLKFEKEDNRHLLMEVLYIIASLFTQQKKFKIAKNYFKRLEKLAEGFQHEKYSEISAFMQGFCDYKNENFSLALKKLEKIDILKAKFINKLQFYTIYGRILLNYEKYEEALQAYLKALIASTEIKISDAIKMQQSQIFYELGVINYKIAIENLKNLGIKKIGNYQTYLQEAINYFEQAVALLIELTDYNILIQIYQLIGNIYEILGKDLKFLEYYNKALECSIDNNNIGKRIKILNRIVQKQTKLSMYEENVVILNDLLSNIHEYKFIDLYTIANFHRQLGDSLIAIGKKTEGLSEQLKAIDILKTFKRPIFEELKLLNQIIKLYIGIKDYEKISYYTEEINNVSKRLNEISIQEPKSFRPMSEVKEIWIFSSIASVEMYSYSPETSIEPDLLGGFLTALQTFSLELTHKQLYDLIIGNDRYMVYQEEGYDFYILGRVDTKVPPEIVKKILSKIYRRFWKEYSNHIKNFQGNTKYFQNFTQIIESLDLTLTI